MDRSDQGSESIEPPDEVFVSEVIGNSLEGPAAHLLGEFRVGPNLEFCVFGHVLAAIAGQFTLAENRSDSHGTLERKKILAQPAFRGVIPKCMSGGV
jgi:hypothetical protein